LVLALFAWCAVLACVHAYESWRHGAWVSVARSLGSHDREAPLAAAPPTPSRVLSHVIGVGFELDAIDRGGCRADEICTIELVVRPTGDYHVNREFPSKLNAESQGAHVLDGSWAMEKEALGVMTMRIVPTAAARSTVVEVRGNLRFSVCTSSVCRAAREPLALSVPVT
jgi:hypothetical protein